MKQIIALCLFVLLLLFGCSSENDGQSVTFYYPRVTYTQNSDDSVVAAETREDINPGTLAQLLNQYLQGPKDPLLKNPFPKDTSILSVYIREDTVYVTVSDHLAQLNGVNLIIACTSLGKTAAHMYQTSDACIICETAQLDGKNSILISDSTILYLDTVTTETTTPVTE